MADTEIPMALFLKMGEAMIGYQRDHYDIDSPSLTEGMALAMQAGKIAFSQVQIASQHPSIISEDMFVEDYRQRICDFLLIPAKMYAEKPQDLEITRLIEGQWDNFKNAVAKKYFSPQVEHSEKQIPELSESEQTRQTSNQLSQ